MLRVIKSTGKKENFNTDKIRESLIDDIATGERIGGIGSTNKKEGDK